MPYGCPYCKMDMKKLEEYCAITKEPTYEAALCDFEFDKYCELYKTALKPITPSESTAMPAGKPKLIQTSIFGAAGEKPFKE